MSTALILFLVAVLLAAAGHKLTARERVAVSAARLARMSPTLGMPLLLAAAAVEALAAAALLVPAMSQAGAVAATAIWTAYAIALAARHGEVLDCGCDLVSRDKPVDLFAIARPALLAALALAAALTPHAPWTYDAPFAALALLALWFTASELAVLPHLARISRR